MGSRRAAFREPLPFLVDERFPSPFTSLVPLAFLTALVLVLSAQSASAADQPVDSSYLSELITEATEKNLASRRPWHLLLHYRENLWGGYLSEADDPRFFLAREGKTDPQAELEATLRQFFSPSLVGRSGQPAQCAFIARYHWLKRELRFDDRRLPPQDCSRFHRWYAEMNPGGITLVFPAAFMNNPASMFGHTFLRVDQRGQTEDTRLLAYTINFAAELATENEIAFAVLGLTGGFKGYFSTMPYYMKVREYRDLENRDMWEYRLDLTEAQIRHLLMHAWELGNTHFDYFFVDENCAYHLLSLLEAADPKLHLTDHFQWYTIPADTVRLIVAQPGLVKEVSFRPSRSTRIKRLRESLAKTDKTLLYSLIDNPAATQTKGFESLSLPRQARLLDLSTEYLQYRIESGVSEARSYRKRRQTLLVRRSKIAARSPPLEIRPFSDRPELGHGTSRMGFGIGWREGEVFEQVAFRTAYHDLLDPERGYTPDAQIELLSASLRHYEQSNRTRLERFTLANIISLSPIDRLFRAPSWKIRARRETIIFPNCRLCAAWNVNAGVGAAFETHVLKREVAFAFAELDANYSHAFQRNHRAGGGGTIGLLADLTERWKILVSGSYLNYPLGQQSDDLRAEVGQRYTLGQNLALRLTWQHRRYDTQALFQIQFYF